MVNFRSAQETRDPRPLSEVDGPESYDRLVAVRQHYDPAAMFRMNHTLRAR
ncbi:BBE domain-containing protein [Micromonospora sp. NPDC049230]|uniref:BBE domain-containing protein n=1 Tax=Micromonospora sp. NPDC049230 TaxID=3155502 RepID=UPI0033FB75F4